MDDIKAKIDELLNAHPDLVEKIKSAPGEVADAIKNATGLKLDGSDFDKVKAAFRDFAGDDGLDLGDFQRAFESLVERGKEAAANIDATAIKDGAADLAAKGASAASDLMAKGSAAAAELAAKAEAQKSAAAEAAEEVATKLVDTVEGAAEELVEEATEIAADVQEVVEEALHKSDESAEE